MASVVNVEEAARWVNRPPLLIPPGIDELAEKYRGRDVCIVGAGPTAMRDLSFEDRPLWTVNGGWISHRTSDLNFMMDDLEGPAWDVIQAQGPDGHRVDVLREEWEPLVQICPTPIITARAYEKFPASVSYPIEEVLHRFGMDTDEDPYFAETVCWTTAWAIHIKVRSIHYYGCDFDRVRPAERAGLEYWIGRAREAGVIVTVADGSKLLKTGPIDHKNRHVSGLYGVGQWVIPRLTRYAKAQYESIPDDEHGGLIGHEAMVKLMAADGVKSILDIGHGDGDFLRELVDAKKSVTGIDPAAHASEGWYEPYNGAYGLMVRGDYLTSQFHEEFDAIWCCHVLEHVDDPHGFLCKMFADLRDNGLLVLTVPPYTEEIVGGHHSLWNAGQLLYHLVRAGFNCRFAQVKRYGYNISVMVRKRGIPADAVPKRPNFPAIEIKDYLPLELEWEGHTFNGEIANINW